MHLTLRLWLRTSILFNRDKKKEAHWLLMELASLLRYRLPVKARLGNGMPIWVPWSDHIGQSIYEQGYYEPELVALIQRLLKPGMVFFDVGAHVGQYTLVASQVVGDAGEVHGFEPDPDTFRLVEQNVKLNNLKNVCLNRMALTSDSGTGYLYLAPVSSLGDNSLSPPKDYSGLRCEVQCTTVDQYLESRHLDRVDCMKIDIEGAELSLLKGANRLFTLKNRPLIVMEFEEARQRAFGNSCKQLADVLKSKGYVLFTLESRLLREYYPSQNDPMSLNVLAVPEEQKESLLTLLGSKTEKAYSK